MLAHNIFIRDGGERKKKEEVSIYIVGCVLTGKQFFFHFYGNYNMKRDIPVTLEMRS